MFDPWDQKIFLFYFCETGSPASQAGIKLDLELLTFFPSTCWLLALQACTTTCHNSKVCETHPKPDACPGSGTKYFSFPWHLKDRESGVLFSLVVSLPGPHRVKGMREQSPLRHLGVVSNLPRRAEKTLLGSYTVGSPVSSRRIGDGWGNPLWECWDVW